MANFKHNKLKVVSGAAKLIKKIVKRLKVFFEVYG